MKYRIVYMVYTCDVDNCGEEYETEHCAGDTDEEMESAEFDYEPYDNLRHDPRRRMPGSWVQVGGKHYCPKHAPTIARQPKVKWGVSKLDENPLAHLYLSERD